MTATETPQAQLAAALVRFQKNMPKVKKEKTATVPTRTGGSYSYTYADLADVMAAAVPKLTLEGLAFTARPRRTEAGDYELAGVLTHQAGGEVEGSLPLYGRTPQEIGSAITYARRYLLGCLTGIVTDDDDDAQAAQTQPERTRRAPTRGEQEAAELDAARGRAFQAWASLRRDHPVPAGMDLRAAFTNAYESDTAAPFLEATVADLDAYTATLTPEQEPPA